MSTWPIPKICHPPHPPTPPSKLFIIYQTPPPPSLHTKPCPSNMLSHTKTSMRSPTSFATTAMTGTNFATTQPIPHGKPRKFPPHLSNCQNTTPLKINDFLPPNHFYRKTHTALCSSPCTMPTSGGCTRKPKHPSGQRKRSTLLGHSGLGQTIC